MSQIRIPTFNSKIQHQRLLPELEAALREVLLNDQSDVVPQVMNLEEQIGDLLGGCHAVGVQSGTAALFLSLKALGVGPGDEVVTVPNTDMATTSAISHTGARFILCDVERDTMNMDPTKLERCITPRTRAILPVHLYGHPADLGPIMEIARRHPIPVVEDATLSLGATYRGQMTGLIGRVGCLSYAAHKIVGGAGNGGMIVTRDADLAFRARLLRGYGMHPDHQQIPATERHTLNRMEYIAEGYNLRQDSIQAAIVRVKLTHFTAWQAERQALAERYARHFAGTAVAAPSVRAGCTHAWRNYVVLVPDRDRVRQELRDRGIATNVPYIPPVHLQPVHRHLSLGPGSFQVAEELADRLVGLPFYPGLAPEQADEVAAAALSAVAAVAGRR